jgi:hypothetical protein
MCFLFGDIAENLKYNKKRKEKNNAQNFSIQMLPPKDESVSVKSKYIYFFTSEKNISSLTCLRSAISISQK